jgi:hypothetical protein
MCLELLARLILSIHFRSPEVLRKQSDSDSVRRTTRARRAKPHVGQCMNTAYTNTGIAVRDIRMYICLINVYISIYTGAILLARFERVACALSSWLGLFCRSTSGHRKCSENRATAIQYATPLGHEERNLTWGSV